MQALLFAASGWLAPARPSRAPHPTVKSVSRTLNAELSITKQYSAAILELEEPAAIEAANKVTSASLTLPPAIAAAPIDATFISTSTEKSSAPPVVLLHSFDSSCLEFRRVLPLLEQANLESYAIDILGWGFIETRGNVRSVGVEAKRAALYAFWKQHLNGRPAIFAGSSLGAATIIDFAAAHPEAVQSTVLIDPQGFIDGAPPVPEPLAKGGVELLRSWPLRWLGQLIAYQDIPRCATDDAIRVGKLHCSRAGWEDDAIDWLFSGGYSVSSLVPTLANVPTTILWGRQDRVLPPQDYLPKFIKALPDATYRWVEDCGHVPHLEQPAIVAKAIEVAVRGGELAGEDARGYTAAEAKNPLQQLNELLDKPILDTNVRGGPLEPFKRFARLEPEAASVIASVAALSFFAVLGRVVVAVIIG